MAIADRLNKLRTDIEDTYQAINNLGGTIPSDKNTNNIPEAIRSVYDNLPKLSDTGTNVSLSPTLKGRLGIVPKGNTYQESTTGKNLFSSSLEQGSISGTTGEDIESTNRVRTTDYVAINSSTQYTLSSKNTNTSKTLQGFIFEYDDNNTFIQRTPSEWTQLPITFTTSATTKKVKIILSYTDATTTNASDFYDMQIEEGSSATSYEPYTGGQPAPSPDYPQEIQSATGTQKVIVSGKNLFDKNGELTQGWIHDNGTILGSGTYTSDYIEVQSNTNYIRTLSESNGFYDENKTFISRTFAKLLTTPSDCKYVRISMPTNNLDTEQLEKGNTATPYQPYQEPQEVDIELGNIELNKIGNYEDYIDGTPDNWVLYKNIGKKILTGDTSEGWTLESNGAFGTRNNFFRDRKILSTSIDGLLSNYYKTSLSGDYYIRWRGSNEPNLNIYNKDISDVSTFRTWLSTHNTEVLYVLAETQQTPITEEPLVSQLNELYYLQSYNDTTNIDVTGNLPMRITASAIKGA